MSIVAYDFHHHPGSSLTNIVIKKIISNPTVNVKKSYELGKKKGLGVQR